MPTLEKELWQSIRLIRLSGIQSCRHWKRNCGKARGSRRRRCRWSCRHWKRNCGKAGVFQFAGGLLSCRHWKRNCGKAPSRWTCGHNPSCRHWKRNCGKAINGTAPCGPASCRHWKRNCGKADVGNCTTIRGVMSNFATDFGWILGRMGNLRGLRGEWPRGGVESVCGWVVKDRGRCTVRIG